MIIIIISWLRTKEIVFHPQPNNAAFRGPSTPDGSTSSRSSHAVTKERPSTLEVPTLPSPSSLSLDTEREIDETDSALSVSDSEDEIEVSGVAKQGEPPLRPEDWAATKSRPRLYRFLLELLDQPDRYPCIQWVNKEQRMFKFMDSGRVAQLWGNRKNRPNMKYENFARSLRCYKNRGILQKPRQKLVYQFAKGW